MASGRFGVWGASRIICVRWLARESRSVNCYGAEPWDLRSLRSRGPCSRTIAVLHCGRTSHDVRCLVALCTRTRSGAMESLGRRPACGGHDRWYFVGTPTFVFAVQYSAYHDDELINFGR